MLTAEKVKTPGGAEFWYASTVRSILQNEKYCGQLLMQKYYTEDFLTHRVVRNEGQRPQYFVEDDHDPIVPKAVFYQVQGEMRRRAALPHDPTRMRFGERLAINGRLVCGACGERILSAVDEYHKTGSLKATARNLNLSTATLRKMLLTAGSWTNKTSVDISILRREHPDWNNVQIAEKLKISVKSVQMYSPYEGLTSMAWSYDTTKAQSQEIVDYGDCGDRVTWTLRENGILTVSGTGPMWDYAGNCYGVNLDPIPKWSHRRDGNRVKKLIVEEGVTSIGQYAFSQIVELEEVILPSSITEINGGAFAGENHVKKVVIPEKVKVISWDTFFSNIWLEEIHIPETVTKVQTYAFHGCMSLKRMYFYGNAPKVMRSTFDMCHEGVVTVYHKEGATGFTDGMWNGYRTGIF